MILLAGLFSASYCTVKIKRICEINKLKIAPHIDMLAALSPSNFLILHEFPHRDNFILKVCSFQIDIISSAAVSNESDETLIIPLSPYYPNLAT